MDELEALYENKLESVYACNLPAAQGAAPEAVSYRTESRAKPAAKVAKPARADPGVPGHQLRIRYRARV